jgi:hypothetical protein
MIMELSTEGFQTVTGTENGTPFTYPTHCKITHYQWHGTLTGPNGVIPFYKDTLTEAYESVQINSLAPEDVAIDHSLIKAVDDSDAKTVVYLPPK